MGPVQEHHRNNECSVKCRIGEQESEMKVSRRQSSGDNDGGEEETKGGSIT